MTVRGEFSWPFAGKTHDRSRGELLAAYGEFLMAAVTLRSSRITKAIDQ